jgi:hypothetical protein
VAWESSAVSIPLAIAAKGQLASTRPQNLELEVLALRIRLEQTSL